MPIDFSYCEAFSRNIGWLSTQEQAGLRNKRIAITAKSRTDRPKVEVIAELARDINPELDFQTYSRSYRGQSVGIVYNCPNKYWRTGLLCFLCAR